jgi:hypothetical protein
MLSGRNGTMQSMPAILLSQQVDDLFVRAREI